MEIRRSYDRLISTMVFPILARRHHYIESGPRPQLAKCMILNRSNGTGCSACMIQSAVDITRSDIQIKNTVYYVYIEYKSQLKFTKDMIYLALTTRVFCQYFVSEMTARYRELTITTNFEGHHKGHCIRHIPRSLPVLIFHTKSFPARDPFY